jgi:hypothetical protein
MKRNALVTGGLLVLALLVVGIAALAGGDSKDDNNAKGTGRDTSKMFKVVEACTAFTLADATAILGDGTKAGTTNGSGDTESSDVAVSTCSYSGASGLTVQDTKTITLLARSAKTKAGAESNKAVFGKDKPAGKQDVDGLADAAFWDEPMSQLHILAANNWYIIGNMSGTNADSGSLEVSRAVFERIKSKL